VADAASPVQQARPAVSSEVSAHCGPEAAVEMKRSLRMRIVWSARLPRGLRSDRAFPENAASLALHTRAGFRVIGTRERIGRHHGKWRDVVLVERCSPTIS
jgi:phosphinothricin acetyltransferase